MLARVLWGLLALVMIGTGLYLFSRLPRRHKKGESPVNMDGGSLGGW